MPNPRNSNDRRVSIVITKKSMCKKAPVLQCTAFSSNWPDSGEPSCQSLDTAARNIYLYERDGRSHGREPEAVVRRRSASSIATPILHWTSSLSSQRCCASEYGYIADGLNRLWFKARFGSKRRTSRAPAPHPMDAGEDEPLLIRTRARSAFSSEGIPLAGAGSCLSYAAFRSSAATST